LWHGNVFRALETVEDLAINLETSEFTVKGEKLLKKLWGFETYIRNNAKLIPNCGEWWRYDGIISTVFVEPTLNQVGSKRMVKKQRMRWSQGGTRGPLQVCDRIPNDEHRATFQHRHSAFAQGEEDQKRTA
jgi:hypothetical protein